MKSARWNNAPRLTQLLTLAMVILAFVFAAPAGHAATEADLTDYAKLTPQLFADAAGTPLPGYVENGQSLFFRLKMSQFDSQALIPFLKANSPVDMTVDIGFTEHMQGSYPTEMYPADFDNVAVYDGQALFRWWIEDGKIHIRFDEDWIRTATTTSTIDAAEVGFSGVVSVQNKPQDGTVIFEAGGESFPLHFKTGYALTKSASAPMYRNGQYEVDYTVTFTLDQDMNVTGQADSSHYSALLTLKDSLAATNSALTGQIVDTPVVTGPTTGVTATAVQSGVTNTFTLGGPSVLKKGTYTLTYTMKVNPDAAAAKLNGYNKTNTVELLENNAPLVSGGQVTPLTATATIAWNNAISNRFKVDKCIVNQNANSMVYRAGSDYYIDYYVVVYTRYEFTTFTVVDQIVANAVHTAHMPVTVMGVNTAEGFWDRAAASGLPALAPVNATVIAPISGNDRAITLTAEDGELLPPGAYYLKVPVKVTDAVLSLAADADNRVGANTTGDAFVQVKNKAILDAVDGDEHVNETTKEITATINGPSSFIKRGAIEMDSSGNYIIYDKEGVRGKLIRWDVTFDWSVPNTETVITDTMRGGQLLLVNGATSFDVWDMSGGTETRLAQLWGKNDTAWIDFGTDANGNETFTFYPGRMSSNPQDSTRKFKLTYYTLVPEETVDFSPMGNSWTVEYGDPVPGTGVGPVTGVDYPQLGEQVRLDLKKTWKYFVNDYVTEWLIELRNPKQIPFTSLTKLIIVDMPTSKGSNAMAAGDVWIDHDRMLTDLPLEVLVWTTNGKSEPLTRGVHYTIHKSHPDYDLGPDGRNGFAVEFNIPAIAELLKKHRASFFATISIQGYVHNADKPTTNTRNWNITNNAYADYSVAGMEVPDEDATAYTNREYSTISKTVGSTVNGQRVIFHDYDGDGDKEIRWEVSIGANEFKTHPDPIAITVTDTLPPELTLDDVAGDGWKTAFQVFAKGDASGKAVIDLTDPSTNASFTYNEATNTFTLTFTKPGGDWARKMGATGTWVSCDIAVRYHTVFKPGELQAALDKAGSSAVTVTVPLSNSASVAWMGNVCGTPESTGDAVINDIVLDKTSKWMPSAGNKVQYTIDINPYSLTLSDDGVLRLQDAMGEGKEDFLYLANTFRLVNVATGMQLAPGSSATANTYVLILAEDGKSFTLDVPDCVPLRLTYQVKTTKPVGTKDVSLVNTASLEGRTVRPVEIVFDVNSSYQSGSFTLLDDEIGIRILKIDSRDAYSETISGLPGAVFTLTELDASGTAIGTPTTLTTDSNGLITIVEAIPSAKIYLIEETAAPSGYMLDEEPWKWCYVLVPMGMHPGNVPEALETALGCSVTVIYGGTYAEELVTNDPVAVTIAKESPDGEALFGAEFILTDASGNVVQPDASAMAGTLKFSGLTAGDYTLTETKAPAGYLLGGETTWRFTVAADGSVTLPANLTYTLLSLNGARLTVTNEPQEVTTQFSGTKSLTGKAIEAGQFSFELVGTDGKVIETVQNAADGSFSFSPITYAITDAGKTFTYTVQEVAGSLPGVTYDATVYTVEVVVTDNGDGTLTATPTANATALNFTNEYEASGDVQFSGTKALTGKALTAGSFSFELLDSEGTVIETVTNAADGTFSFAPITYTVEDAGKTFTYTVQEVAGAQPGVTYDATVYTVEVVVTDNGDGTLTATPTANATALNFTNEYEASGDVQFSGVKTLTGKALTAGTFSFELLDSEGTVIETVTNAADGSFSFSPITYAITDAGKTFTYTVQEVAGSLPGVTYDDTVYTVEVTVTDNGDGTLTATPTANATALNFTNEYEASGDVQFSGVKTLSGKSLTAGSFSFELLDSEGKVIETVTNAADGSFSFSPITYTVEDTGKTFTYTVQEVAGAQPGVTYDATVYTVEVVVTDNGDGTLTATPTANATALNFTNEYEASGDVQFSGTKALTGKAIEAGQFSFELVDADGKVIETVTNSADGSFSFAPITYTVEDAGKTFTYTVQEVAGSLPGVTYDATVYTVEVVVTDNGDGTLTATPTANATALNFTNEYEASGDVQFSGSKTLSGKAIEAGQFSFELVGADGKVIETVQNAADGSFSFAPITYAIEDAGKTFTYTVQEVAGTQPGMTYDATVYTVEVVVTDNGDGTLTATPTANATALNFTNEYEASGDVQFSGTKALTGKALTAGSFSFELLDSEGTAIETVTNAADGSFSFSPITYAITDAGKTFTYTVREVAGAQPGVTYDATVYTVEVVVTDNGDGTLTATPTANATALNFTNEYEASGDVQFSGAKALTGKAIEAGQFSFELVGADGKVIETVTNAADGSFSFSPITYAITDAGKAFTYTVREVAGSLPGVTYDDTVYTVEVTVTDNGDGTLTATPTANATALNFTNEYEASGDVQFSGTKALTGKAIEAGKFSFELVGADGKVIETVTNAADGSFSFSPITYAIEDAGKTFTYTVQEVAGSMPGVTYDATVYTVEVVVTDNGDGTLTATPTANATTLNFTNEYEASGDVQFSGVKTLTGKAIEAGQFSFELVGADGKVIETVTNAADGSFSFSPITYAIEDAGKTFTYTVQEVAGSMPGVTYDTTVYTVEVVVTDNGDGTLTATPTANATALNFTNAFEAEGEITLTARKTVNGTEPADDEIFRFVLADETGAVLETVQNDGSAITFAPLAFDQDDVGQTFIYTVYEAEDDRPYFTTDERVYTVRITVALDDSDALTFHQEVLCNGTAQSAISFDNIYEATGSLQLTALKTVNQAVPTADQVYEFVLEGEGVSITAVNEGESVIFDALTYDLADAGKTFTYTIRETTAAAGSMTPDASVYTVEVTVIDNGDGTLTASPIATLAGEAVSSIIFNNVIDAPLTISKTVEGCETDKTFVFTLHFYHADGAEMTAPVAYDGDLSGELVSGESIHLGHNQSVTFTGLQPGMLYTVEETPDVAFITLVNGTRMNIVDGVCLESGTRADFLNVMKTTEFSVRKVWEGGNGGEIILTLYANGEKLDPQPVYTHEGDRYTYTELPMYDAYGDEIVYSAKEKYMDGYLTIYDNVAPYADESRRIYDGGTIINRGVTSLRVRKLWVGLDEGEAPPPIQLVLYCNGQPMDKQQPEPDENGWYVYQNLPLLYQGEPAFYTVEEVSMLGYAVAYTTSGGSDAENAADGFTITNTRIPATADPVPLTLWAALFTASAAALLLLLRRRRANP